MADFREYSAAFHKQNDDVMHFGIKDMHWGIRRYQNPDGTLTPAGKLRYNKLKEKAESLKNPDGSWNNKALKVNKKATKYGFETKEERNKRYEEIDNRNKRSTDAIKSSGFERDEYDDFVKKVSVKDSNGKDKNIQFSVDQDNDSIKNDNGELKRSISDFSKNFSEHEKAIRSQIKKDLYERIRKYDYDDDDADYFKKMADKMGKGYFNVRYIGPDDFQIYVDDGVNDYFLPSFEYDAKHKKIIGGVALDD